LQPTVFYRWQKEFFENGAAAFQAKGCTDHRAEQERIEYLEKKIQRKDEVLVDVRDQIVDFVRRWSETSEIGAGRFVGWLGLSTSKSTICENATAASTSTTVGFPGPLGWRTTGG
jgi:hypothetical protein